MRKPERRELVVVRGWKRERRAKEVEGEEAHRTTVDLALQTKRLQREDPPGCPRGDPGTRRAPVPFSAIREEEWRAGYAVSRSSSGTGRYAFHVGKDATCFTLFVWSRPSREARHRHHSAAQQPTAEPSTQDGTHWSRRSKRIRVSATGPGGWEGEPWATRTCAAEGFGTDGIRAAWV